MYGFVDLTELELRLIDTSMFRRLHRIKQLSHAYLAYPSAVHTRFEHSIGAMHVANMLSMRLGLKDEEREIVRLAALLHDIGHGPFSHLFEEVLRKLNGAKMGHEKVSTMIVREDEQVSGLLGNKAEMVAQLLEHQPVDGWTESDSTLATDIVSGPLDADKMDYLRRDSYHVGVEYGRFDLHRLIRTMTSTSGVERRLCVDYKGVDSAENYRLGRHLMQVQVYNHHARLVGDRMFMRALNMSLGDAISADLLTVRSDHREFLDYYAGLDDYNIYDTIMKGGGPASDLLADVYKRALLKRAVDVHPSLEVASLPIRTSILKKTANDLDELASVIAKDAGVDEHRVILYVSSIPIKLYGDAFSVMHKGIPRSVAELSPISAQEAISRFYAFCPPDEHSQRAIRERVRDELGIP